MLINTLSAILVTVIVLYVCYILNYSNDRFAVKGVIFAPVFIMYSILIFLLKLEYLIYLLIFLSFFTIPMESLSTSSTNLLILLFVIVCFFRAALLKKNIISLQLIKKNSLTLPLILIILSYTISFAFIEKDWNYHIMFYQSIISVSIFVFIVIGSIKKPEQILRINKIFLIVLIGNLLFSFFFLLWPNIDSIRADFLSLPIMSGEVASRIQGLTFRWEAYGEYLMICSLWLMLMLMRGQFKKRKYLLWIITFITISVLILTRLRGSTIIFLLGILIFTLTSRSIIFPKKILALVSIITFFMLVQFIVDTFTDRVTLLDRLYELTDQNQRVGYIPETRYFTWIPTWRLAQSKGYLGIGPSFAPYVKNISWSDVVSSNGSGESTVWPHNLTILILCTVGLYGLISYIFLIYRTIRLRKIFIKLDKYYEYTYSSYLFCFLMLLLETQKFDGILRTPGASFYLFFIMIALMFTSENIVRISQTNEIEHIQPETIHVAFKATLNV